jgi:hypothetical protein
VVQNAGGEVGLCFQGDDLRWKHSNLRWHREKNGEIGAFENPTFYVVSG